MRTNRKIVENCIDADVVLAAEDTDAEELKSLPSAISAKVLLVLGLQHEWL